MPNAFKQIGIIGVNYRQENITETVLALKTLAAVSPGHNHYGC